MSTLGDLTRSMTEEELDEYLDNLKPAQRNREIERLWGNPQISAVRKLVTRAHSRSK